MPISCDSHYIITSMVELGDILPDTYEYCFIAEHDIDGIVDRNANINAEIEQGYANWYSNADPMQRAYLGASFLLGCDLLMESIICRTAESHHKGTPIKKYLDDNYGQRYVKMFNDRFAQSVENFTAVPLLELSMWDRLRRTKYRQDIEAMEHRINVVEDEALRNNIKKKRRAFLKKARGVVKKSLKLFGRVFSEDEARVFIGGGEIKIEGKMFDYIVKKSITDVLNHSVEPSSWHIPYELIIQDKNGIVMGNGCVYFEDTPLIDQIVALNMYVKHDEEHLIKTTNFFNTTPQYKANDDIQRLKKPQAMVLHEDGGNPFNIPRPVIPYEKHYDAVLAALPEHFGMTQSAIDFLYRPTIRLDQLPDVATNDRLFVEASNLPLLEYYNEQMAI